MSIRQAAWTSLLMMSLLALTPRLAWSARSPSGAQSTTGAQSTAATATDASLKVPPRAWADAMGSNQERIVREGDNEPLRYLLRKIDRKGDTTREFIESKDGAVARLVQKNGAPITAEDDHDERERLEGLLQTPDAFARHHRHDAAEREYVLELIHNMPAAMIWSYAPGQPQQAKLPHRQVVLDFTPDPKFKPPSIVTEGLTGIAGRVWIDEGTHCVLRLEMRVLHTVNFGWGGVLARINAGGTVEMDQAYVGEHRWIYTHVTEHIVVREVLVHVVAENVEMNAWDAHVLPAEIPYQEAIHELLAIPVPTH